MIIILASVHDCQCPWCISSRFSRNSEANVSEFLENLKKYILITTCIAMCSAYSNLKIRYSVSEELSKNNSLHVIKIHNWNLLEQIAITF